jgi:hypothetical protein
MNRSFVWSLREQAAPGSGLGTGAANWDWFISPAMDQVERNGREKQSSKSVMEPAALISPQENQGISENVGPYYIRNLDPDDITFPFPA